MFIHHCAGRRRFDRPFALTARSVAALLASWAMLMFGGCTLSMVTPTPLEPLDTIAFGSCAEQDQPQPIWEAVIANQPDRFVFLGDNIYGDTTDMAVLRAKYAQLAAKPGFQRLKTNTPILATWDDHDYGANDAGAEYPMKAASKQIFLDFFGEPADSERRQRAGGVYTAYLEGPPGRRVQLILLDTRWDRSPLQRASPALIAARRAIFMGPYLPRSGPEVRLLGEDQWRWLESELRRPAEVRIIATSIPFLQEGTGYENWSNFPQERERLVALITQTQANGVIFITGDTHRGQFDLRTVGTPYPFWEVNSSGLTQHYEAPVPDKNRLGELYGKPNFGLIRINWNETDPEITLEIRSGENALVLQNTLRLSHLQLQP